MTLRRHWLYATSGVGLLIVVIGLFLEFLPRSAEEIVVLGADTEQTASSSGIVVDISGAVNRPGVYTFGYGDRVVDALEKAGGLTTTVDQGWVDKNLNKSERLKDGIKLYIPSKNEVSKTSNLISRSPEVDINTADSQTLESLNGIGAATAKKIISARPYSRIEELLEKKVISKTVFERIRDSIRI